MLVNMVAAKEELSGEKKQFYIVEKGHFLYVFRVK